MYKFKFVEPFPCSARQTFEETTKDFEQLVKHIPNVTKIKTLSTETLPDGSIRKVLKFHGDGAIPLIARPVIRPEMLRWEEELICNPNDLSIKWTIKTDHFTEHVHVGGITMNRDTNNGSEIVLDGYMNITLSHIPGFPDHIVKKAVEMVEPFIGKLVSPNLKTFYKAVKMRMKEKK